MAPQQVNWFYDFAFVRPQVGAIDYAGVQPLQCKSCLGHCFIRVVSVPFPDILDMPL